MLEVQYFGEIEDKAGKAKEMLPAEVKTVKGLLAYLKSAYSIEETGMQIAINHTLVDLKEEILLSNTDEIAILSPFAGG